MSKSGDKKGPDEYILMRQIYDNLQYLDYETEFDPVKRHFPYLTTVYFAIPGQSSKEQFDYFAALCIWLMQTFLGSTIETPSDYDEPAQVADNLILALPQIGFKLNFSSSKLVPGHGLPVCTILDAIIRQTLKKKHFTPRSLKTIGGTGGHDEVETVGDDDEDDDGIIDDAVDIASDDEIDAGAGNTYEIGNEGGQKVIDSLELKAEAERVAARLQIRIPAAKSDWRSHFQQMSQHQSRINEIMSQLTPILSKVGADVNRAIQAIQTREKTLNSRFETSVSEYASRASELATVEARHRARVAEVNALQTELNSVIEKLSSTKEILDEKQKEVSDNSPLMKMKQAISKLKEEIKALELRSSILQRSLTQTWLDDKEIES
ncbi:Intraflagellar transport protein 57 [Tritrichomonas musculus]|uniref:Intraflagellar transport protein 57 n=1 Tax=Tritrichomonas musculus TaxID=1915356 RepID=A0ABR2IPW3_9EUKA